MPSNVREFRQQFLFLCQIQHLFSCLLLAWVGFYHRMFTPHLSSLAFPHYLCVQKPSLYRFFGLSGHIKCLHFMLLISHAVLLFSSSYQPLRRLLLNIHKVSKLQDIAARYQLCSGTNTTTRWSHLWDCRGTSTPNTLKVTQQWVWSWPYECCS